MQPCATLLPAARASSSRQRRTIRAVCSPAVSRLLRTAGSRNAMQHAGAGGGQEGGGVGRRFAQRSTRLARHVMRGARRCPSALSCAARLGVTGAELTAADAGLSATQSRSCDGAPQAIGSRLLPAHAVALEALRARVASGAYRRAGQRRRVRLASPRGASRSSSLRAEGCACTVRAPPQSRCAPHHDPCLTSGTCSSLHLMLLPRFREPSRRQSPAASVPAPASHCTSSALPPSVGPRLCVRRAQSTRGHGRATGAARRVDNGGLLVRGRKLRESGHPTAAG